MLDLAKVVVLLCGLTSFTGATRSSRRGGSRRGITTPSGPIVVLPYSTFEGAVKSPGVESWLGMPYAHQPVGDLRLRLPVVPPPTIPPTTIVDATEYGPMCIQQSILTGEVLDITIPAIVTELIDDIISSPLYNATGFADSEACLSINVHRPAGTLANASLPVVIFIHGGGFLVGGSSAVINLPLATALPIISYDHSQIVARSVALGTPIIHVSLNYRLNAFGFLSGKEIKEAGLGNLGLHDQREGIRWVKKYIKYFGGDPDAVTLWGESAGAVSVSLHTVASNATEEKNFRGVFADSGAVDAFGDITQPSKQAVFDIFTDAVNCSDAKDVLACLRDVPLADYRKAMNIQPGLLTGYGGLRFPYEPSYDGCFFEDTPQNLLLAGKYLKVPVVQGDNDDEGTLFSLTQSNVTTDAAFKDYLKQVWLADATEADIDAVAAAYPSDPTKGSPYGTGILNELYSGYKRMAAFQGDVWFQAPRRMMLAEFSKSQPTWSFLNKRLKELPILGAFHISDLLLDTGLLWPTASGGLFDNTYADILINFVSTLNPNSPASRPSSLSNIPTWPEWKAGGQVLTMTDIEEGATELVEAIEGLVKDLLAGTLSNITLSTGSLELTKDNYRTEAMETLNRVFLANPF